MHETRPSAEVGDRELTLSTMGLSNSTVKDRHTKKNSEQCRLSFLSLFRPTLRKRATHETTRHVMDYVLGDPLQNPSPYMRIHNVAASKIRAE